jgi:hypothetical protein
VAARQEWDATEEKVSSMVAEAAMANQQWEAIEEHCVCLVQELTFLSIRGSELCITMTCSPKRTLCTRECTLQRPGKLKWPHSSSCFGRGCLWPPNPLSAIWSWMFPKRVLLER